MPKKRNWAAICQIQDIHLRTLLSLTTDQELLAKVALGFPELFMGGEDEGPLRVPLSALMEAAYEFSAENSDQEYWEKDRHFSLILAKFFRPHFNIPIAHSFGENGDEVPSSIPRQLVGQKAQAGMTLEYLGERYVVMDITFEEGYPEIGTTFEEAPALHDIKLVRVEFVALDK